MKERLTFDDWAAAGAPLDHAPAPSHAYVLRGGTWFNEYEPAVQAVVERAGVDLSVGAMTAMWCAIVAVKS